MRYQTPVGQLVFHSDFPLPADHRLVRELTAERDDVNRTLGLAPSNEPIDVYLVSRCRAISGIPEAEFPERAVAAGVLFGDRYAAWRCTRIGTTAWRRTCDMRLRTDTCTRRCRAFRCGWTKDWRNTSKCRVVRAGLNRPHVDLLSDMTQKENWRPNLPRLEKLTEAGQMDQRDYAESWAWVYFFLNSPPERREILTNYLAQLRSRGASEPLSVRLAALQVEPGEPLTKYIATLEADTTSLSGGQSRDPPSERCARGARHTLCIFAVHHAFVDLLEAELGVHREGRRVLLHRLGFDQENAAVAEAFERFAEQERRKAFASLIGRHAQVEHAGGRSAPGGGEGFDIPEPHIGHRFAAAGRVSRKRIRSKAPVVQASQYDFEGGNSRAPGSSDLLRQ